ncbi:MAG: lysophospholipid acyltransferase family protein [Steroidobacteraceae bacterium]|nr:lysophospholipid acyltransferase family protein [Nevskiaceae bacterium]MCP5338997.1 lysophospholipid acyltransferase family protein [Nevskiaceae bacterium]MCP5359591.1 lysophospholipid acyltransferase family protein [Nevskiaceae bacterium]MCP5472616.1 lysophospholipid acyltransferase family protein [Nevskiaceae bacterium]
MIAPPPEVPIVPARPSGWLRLLAALPMPVLHGFAGFLAWLAYRVFPYRPKVVLENLAIAFPDLDEPAQHALMRAFYAGHADVLVEIIKSAAIRPEELLRRVEVHGLEQVRERVATGRPVLLLAAHQGNWEWLLLALSLSLDVPLDAAYKPLVDPWADRAMKALRGRFGARLVPAPELLIDILRRRNLPRAIALVADQEPVASESKHWTRFLNRDSAFYLGAEEIARKTGYPALFVAMRRTARGHYRVELEPLVEAREVLPPGAFTERYARRVEAQIRESPPDWPWSHKRWRLRKPLYG